ncbi:membrane protein [Aquimarina atlantica]|uniref:Membrane protein n=2 Tax=Aquimarina atlantica TaxID=1317122 RepID=A0A023BQZ4_9FLAO|nr:membrane protein [Aquimarina atlantica]
MVMYSKLLKDFKEMYMAYIPLMIILSSCLGSVAAMYILMQERSLSQVVQLSLCVIVCMAFNASILAQMKAKFVFNLLIASLVINTLLVLLNIAFY